MRRLGLFLVVLAVLASAAMAASRIELWKSGKESLRFVVRDDAGLFVRWGKLECKSWNDGDNTSEWVTRHADGTFVTGYKGRLEKFRVKAGQNERTRLVVRNSKGEFVTWADMDKLLSAKWERFRDGWRYVVRYNGKFVNWSKGNLEQWNGFGKVLVVRDTSDDQNNGKILTWIAPKKDGRGQIHYRDPDSGKFVR